MKHGYSPAGRPAEFFGLYKSAHDFRQPKLKDLSVDELIELSPAKQMAYIQRIRVPHAKFARLLDECQAKFNYSRATSSPGGLVIVGPSRSGKTTLIEQFAEMYPARKSRDGDDVIRVLVATTPPYPDANAILEQCLFALDDPLWFSGTKKMKRERLKLLLARCQVKIVFLDETQHLVDNTGAATEIGAAILLQQLVEEVNIPFVLLGLERTKNLFRGNSALRNRFESPLYFDQYDWNKAEDRNAWGDYIESFVSRLPYRNVPDFSSRRLAKKVWYASFGLAGLNAKLFWKCVDITSRETERKDTLTMETLAEAFKRTAWESETGLENPFLPGSAAEEGRLPPIVEDYNAIIQKRHDQKTFRGEMVELTHALKKLTA